MLICVDDVRTEMEMKCTCVSSRYVTLSDLKLRYRDRLRDTLCYALPVSYAVRYTVCCAVHFRSCAMCYAMRYAIPYAIPYVPLHIALHSTSLSSQRRLINLPLADISKDPSGRVSRGVACMLESFTP